MWDFLLHHDQTLFKEISSRRVMFIQLSASDLSTDILDIIGGSVA